MDKIKGQVDQLLTDDYLQTVKSLTGKEMCCMKTSTTLAIISGVLTGAASMLSFSAGYFKTPYLPFLAGCTGIFAMVCLKASYYTASQSTYHDIKLKNHLTKDFQFTHHFITDPMNLHPVSDPSLPDPMAMSAPVPPSVIERSPTPAKPPKPDVSHQEPPAIIMPVEQPPAIVMDSSSSDEPVPEIRLELETTEVNRVIEPKDRPGV